MSVIPRLKDDENIDIDGSLKFLISNFLRFGHRAISKTLNRKLQEGFYNKDLRELRIICDEVLFTIKKDYGERVYNEVKNGLDILFVFLDCDDAYMCIFRRILKRVQSNRN